MASFHPFPRLPTELRREIWDLALTPRMVEIWVKFGDEPDGEEWDDAGNRVDRRPILFYYSTDWVPATLQACRESRAYLCGAGGYTKAFTGGSLPNYTWVNFAIDAIRAEVSPEDVVAQEHKRITRLFLAWPFVLLDFFEEGDIVPKLLPDSSVKELTIKEVDMELHYYVTDWLYEAPKFMMRLYYRCDPVSYYTTVLCPDILGEDFEMNPENYLEVFEAGRQKYADPEYGVERDFRPLPWRHTETCSCEDRDEPGPRTHTSRPESSDFYARRFGD